MNDPGHCAIIEDTLANIFDVSLNLGLRKASQGHPIPEELQRFGDDISHDYPTATIK